MNGRSQNDKIILGLKIKQFRTNQGFSLSDLRKKTGMSMSYLNEIEKGKKYPKQDKLELLATALQLPYEELVSTELPPKLEPIRELLNSNFLNDLPLDLFKIELVKIVEIIASAPAQVGAFISTLVDLSKNYELQQESFYFAALRSYLELHNNYFEELEVKVKELIATYQLPESGWIQVEQLASILEQRFGYTIIYNGLDTYPDLKQFRSVYIPKEKKLLLNSQLTDRQCAFQLGKELGFNYLNIKERAVTSSLLRAKSFNEILNHSKGIYFSVALLMNESDFIKDTQALFDMKQWNGSAFLEMMQKYGASPEMFFHRFTNILPKAFGLEKIFFTRMVHKSSSNHFEVDRELHLDDRRYMSRNELNEHYCRRWVALSSLNALKKEQKGHYTVSIQRSQHYATQDEYLCLTIARSAYPSPDRHVSTTLGMLINAKVVEKIRFLNDQDIPKVVVNQTCERCPIRDCRERVAPPIIIQQKERKKQMQQALESLIK
ncbi:MAG: helix-turn-helix domain-containing protein [Bacteroidota bacterium]